MSRARKVILLIILIFAVYAILNSPQQSAEVVKSAFAQLLEGLRAIGQFFDSLISSE